MPYSSLATKNLTGTPCSSAIAWRGRSSPAWRSSPPRGGSRSARARSTASAGLPWPWASIWIVKTFRPAGSDAARFARSRRAIGDDPARPERVERVEGVIRRQRVARPAGPVAEAAVGVRAASGGRRRTPRDPPARRRAASSARDRRPGVGHVVDAADCGAGLVGEAAARELAGASQAMVSVAFRPPAPEQRRSAWRPHQVFSTWPSPPSAAGVLLKLPLSRRRASR